MPGATARVPSGRWLPAEDGRGTRVAATPLPCHVAPQRNISPCLLGADVKEILRVRAQDDRTRSGYRTDTSTVADSSEWQGKRSVASTMHRGGSPSVTLSSIVWEPAVKWRLSSNRSRLSDATHRRETDRCRLNRLALLNRISAYGASQEARLIRFSSNRSASTRHIIASTTGTARGTTHGSWRPSTRIVRGWPWISTVS